MENPKSYAESIEAIAHSEYVKTETELSEAVKELSRLTEAGNYDDVPFELVDKITELQDELGVRLKDWLESMGLDQ